MEPPAPLVTTLMADTSRFAKGTFVYERRRYSLQNEYDITTLLWFEASRKISQLRVVYKIVASNGRILYASGDIWPQYSINKRHDKYKYEVVLPSFTFMAETDVHVPLSCSP